MEELKVLSMEEIYKIRNERKEGINNIVINSKRVEDPIHPKESPLMGMFRGFLLDRKKAGFAINWDHGTVISYGLISDDVVYETFFRGENKVYPGDATSSIARKDISCDDCELTIYTKLLVQYMKINILSDILDNNDITKNWEFGTILTYMIAQHYGLRTQYLDITDDIDVALFFANTYEKDGVFHPILENNKEYGEYACLYMLKTSFNTKIKPIGYQPFTRCHKQRGYFIDTNENNNIKDFGLSKDCNFIKYKFKRNDKLTLELVSQFDYGNLIYPIHEKDTLIKIIEQIESETTYTLNEVDDVNGYLNDKYSINQVLEKLKELNYQIVNQVNRRYINEKITLLNFNDYLKREGINITTRMVYKPSIRR